MSEKFLAQLFSKFKTADFNRNELLKSFHEYYKSEKKKKEEHVTLFECYIEYVTRNIDHKENEKDENIKKLCDKIKRSILKISRAKQKTQTSGSSEKKVVKINMAAALKVLSNFIEESSIVTYDDPEQEYNEKDEEFMETATGNIMDEVLLEYKKKGKKLPDPQPDVVFGQRSEMLSIWQDTRKKCEELITSNEQLMKLLTKIFYVDTAPFIGHKSFAKQTQINTILLQSEPIPQIEHQTKTDGSKTFKVDYVKEIILPSENFIACYSSAQYNTVVTLTNNQPIDDIISRTKDKIRSIYICSGSQNICGGNADQGIDVTESMLYMTSSYSIAIDKVTHAYPLGQSHAVLCPNVLIFKSSKYATLPVSQWKKVAVMNLPSKYKPATNIKDLFSSDRFDDRIYDINTTISHEYFEQIKSTLIGGVELALFFGYDTIILDDRGIADNWIPAHSVARIIREVTDIFKGRVKEFVISVPKAKSFSVLRYYFK